MNLDFFCLREYSPSVRVEVIDYALRQNKGYGPVSYTHLDVYKRQIKTATKMPAILPLSL